jgi:hypothetical protein
LTADEIQHLADRLFSRGCSSLTTYSRREQQDLVLASKTLRALLRKYERSTGRQLQALFLDRGCLMPSVAFFMLGFFGGGITGVIIAAMFEIGEGRRW